MKPLHRQIAHDVAKPIYIVVMHNEVSFKLFRELRHQLTFSGVFHQLFDEFTPDIDRPFMK